MTSHFVIYTSTVAVPEENLIIYATTYFSQHEPIYLLITTNDIQSDLQPKVYKIYACFDTEKRRQACTIFKNFDFQSRKPLITEIVKIHDEIESNTNSFRIVKEFGDYNKWYDIVKGEIEKQTKLIVRIKPKNSNSSEESHDKRIKKLGNLLKPKKDVNKMKQVKTLSNSLKEISVIYINSNDYDKQLNKVKEIINNKEESIDIVQYNGRGWMGAHHGNKICWLKDFVDYMDFNTFISFIDSYRREFSNDGSHFMNDYCLFIINSYIPFNKLFGTLISEEQRALLNKRIITKFNLDD